MSVHEEPKKEKEKEKISKGQHEIKKKKKNSRVLCENNLLLLFPLTLSSKRVNKTENQKYLTAVTDSQREKE